MLRLNYLLKANLAYKLVSQISYYSTSHSLPSYIISSHFFDSFRVSSYHHVSTPYCFCISYSIFVSCRLNLSCCLSASFSITFKLHLNLFGSFKKCHSQAETLIHHLHLLPVVSSCRVSKVESALDYCAQSLLQRDLSVRILHADHFVLQLRLLNQYLMLQLLYSVICLVKCLSARCFLHPLRELSLQIDR